MRNLRIALAALFALLLLSFIFQNRFDVSVKFWPFLGMNAPLWLVIVGSAGLGVLAYHFFQAFRRSRKSQP